MAWTTALAVGIFTASLTFPRGDAFGFIIPAFAAILAGPIHLLLQAWLSHLPNGGKKTTSYFSWSLVVALLVSTPPPFQVISGFAGLLVILTAIMGFESDCSQALKSRENGQKS